MPKGSAVADVEAKLKAEYGSNKHAIYGTLNKVGLMHGNKPTAKGFKKVKNKQLSRRSRKIGSIAKRVSRSYG